MTAKTLAPTDLLKAYEAVYNFCSHIFTIKCNSLSDCMIYNIAKTLVPISLLNAQMAVYDFYECCLSNINGLPDCTINNIAKTFVPVKRIAP